MYKVIVAGSRNFNDYSLLESSLIHFLTGRRPSEVMIVSGAARGADTLGERFAKEKKCQIARFPADWNKGRGAGYIRNTEMAKFADACVVFWDGESKGTEHMINLAEKHDLDLKIVYYKNK